MHCEHSSAYHLRARSIAEAAGLAELFIEETADSCLSVVLARVSKSLSLIVPVNIRCLTLVYICRVSHQTKPASFSTLSALSPEEPILQTPSSLQASIIVSLEAEGYTAVCCCVHHCAAIWAARFRCAVSLSLSRSRRRVAILPDRSASSNAGDTAGRLAPTSCLGRVSPTGDAAAGSAAAAAAADTRSMRPTVSLSLALHTSQGSPVVSRAGTRLALRIWCPQRPRSRLLGACSHAEGRR